MSVKAFVCLVAAGAVLVSAAAWAEDWPHWRGPTYNGLAPNSPPLVDAFGPDGPKKVWESETLYEGATEVGAGSVTVSDGRAYAYVHPRYVQNRPWKQLSKDFVFCFDASTGKTLWKTELPSWYMGWSASCSPTIADGRCYILSSEAHVYCLDAKTGQEIWKSEFIGKEGNKHNRSSSPLVVDGVVVVVTSVNAVGLDARTGKTLWRDAQARTECGSAVPWKTDGKTCAVMLAGRAHCYEPKTGKNLWERVSGGNGASPVIVGNVMAVKSGETVTLYTLDPAAPRRMWQVKFMDQFTTPTIHDGHVYVFGQAFDNKHPSRAVCVEVATGRVSWDEEVGPFEFSSATVADGKILLVGRDTLHLIKATPGKYTELGRAKMALRTHSSVGFADGKIYLRKKNSVVCCDLRK